MFPQTKLTELLDIKYPIVQAPMAGGPTTPELVAAVCNAGALGSFAAAMLTPEKILSGIIEVRKRTSRPFNVNLFVLEEPKPNPAEVAKAIERLQPFREELRMPPAIVPDKYCEDPAAQFEAVLEAHPAVASFTFGILNKAQMSALKSRGTIVFGTATTVAEARAWEAIGADAICAQGSEAGAHRGTFLGASNEDFEQAMVGTMALVPQICDAVRVPVIAAGGIMDGRGIAASLMLGAAGVQMGTAFLTCPEAGTPLVWKDALRNACDNGTRVTRVYSGRPARGIVNDFMRTLKPAEQDIPAYPIQNKLTGPLRKAAAEANRPEFLSLWAGQGASLSRGLPAAEFVASLAAETLAALSDCKKANVSRF